MDWASIGNSLGQGALSSVANTALDYLLPFSKSTDRAYKEQREAQQRDQDFQREMWNKVSYWNSPLNQGKLMSQGGFSPAALFGQNGSSISQMSQPSGGSHGVSPFSTVSENSPLQPFSTLAQAVSSFAQADKDTASIPLINANIKSVLSDSRLKDLQSDYQTLENELQRIYGSELRENQVRDLASSALLKMAEADLAALKGETEKADKLLKDSMSDFYDSMKGLNESQQRMLQIQLKFEEQRIRLNLQNTSAQTGLYNAQNKFYTALSETENQLRDGKITQLDLSNKIDDVRRQLSNRENIRDAALHQDKIRMFLESLEQAELINQQGLFKLTEMLDNDNFRGLERGMGVLSTVIQGATSVGSLRVAEYSAQEKVKIQREFNRIMEQGQHRSETRYKHDGDGWVPEWHIDY